MPKAIAHPTDGRLLDKARQSLVQAAQVHALTLRQNYNRIASRLAAQTGCYIHAKQFKRMPKAVRMLRSRVGRVPRDVQRQVERLPEQARAKVQESLQRTGRNPLKGTLGNALHAVICGAWHNLRLILAALRLLCANFGLTMQVVICALIAATVDQRPVSG